MEEKIVELLTKNNGLVKINERAERQVEMQLPINGQAEKLMAVVQEFLQGENNG